MNAIYIFWKKISDEPGVPGEPYIFSRSLVNLAYIVNHIYFTFIGEPGVRSEPYIFVRSPVTLAYIVISFIFGLLVNLAYLVNVGEPF